jgi:hypothetical protein
VGNETCFVIYKLSLTFLANKLKRVIGNSHASGILVNRTKSEKNIPLPGIKTTLEEINVSSECCPHKLINWTVLIDVSFQET